MNTAESKIQTCFQKKRKWAPSATYLVYCTSEPNDKNTKHRIITL